MVTIEDLINGWCYEYDKKVDNWEILRPDSQGKFYGDCDDFALTALYILEKRSLMKFWFALITRRGKIHFVEVGGEGHAVLEYNGLYIDNIQRRWCSKKELQSWVEPYFFRYRTKVPVIAYKMTLGQLKKAYKWLKVLNR